LLKICGANTPLFELGVIPNTKKNNNQEKSNIFNQYERQRNGGSGMTAV
jgi:hypothetical protein